MSEIISNVESVTTAAKIVSAQKVETSQLCIDGKDLQALKEERALSYKELITRMELSDDEIWALYTDSGDIVYWHNADKMNMNLAQGAFRLSAFHQLPREIKWNEMTIGSYLFNGNQNLTHINTDFSSLSSAYCMFADCINLKSFQGSLCSLIDGGYMFYKTAISSFKTDNLNNLQKRNYYVSKLQKPFCILLWASFSFQCLSNVSRMQT